MKKITIIVLSLFCSLPAFAAAPLITDDTGTQGKGKFQVELDYSAVLPNMASARDVAPALTWGIIDNVDVIIALPYAWQTVAQSNILPEGHHHAESENTIAFLNQKGNGDMSVDVKWRFFESKPNGMSLAVKPGFTLPTGNEQNGFGNGRICERVMLIATKEWEHGALHGNAGYSRNAYSLDVDNASLRHDLWHASLAAELNMMKNLRSVADIGVDTNIVKAPDANPVYLIGGLIYSVTENFDLDMGVQWGLNNALPNATFLTGLTARF